MLKVVPPWSFVKPVTNAPKKIWRHITGAAVLKKLWSLKKKMTDRAFVLARIKSP